jgi:hypothetical protein
MRLQLELPEERVHELKGLMGETRAESYKELFNNALSVFEWAVDEAKKGNSIAAVNEKEEVYRVLVIPALEGVAKRHAKQTAGVTAGAGA